LRAGESVLEASGSVFDMSLKNFQSADTLVGGGFDVESVAQFKMEGCTAMSMLSVPSYFSVDAIPGGAYTLQTNSVRDLGSTNIDRRTAVYADLDTRLLTRANAGTPTMALGTSVALQPTTSGSVTITTGQVAPDGTLTASLYGVPAGSGSTDYARTALNANFTLADGDFIVWGGWFKATDDLGMVEDPIVCLFNVHNGLDFDITFRPFKQAGNNGSANTAVMSGSTGYWKNVGWVPQYGVTRVTGTPSGQQNLIFNFHGAQGHSYHFWKCYYSIIPASLGLTRGTIVHYLDSIGVIPVGLKSGVTGMQSHQTFATGKGLFSARPSASAVGQGAQWFATDKGKPIWSDGTNWLDANGAIVNP
jgi:hypothetical protein